MKQLFMSILFAASMIGWLSSCSTVGMVSAINSINNSISHNPYPTAPLPSIPPSNPTQPQPGTFTPVAPHIPAPTQPPVVSLPSNDLTPTQPNNVDLTENPLPVERTSNLENLNSRLSTIERTDSASVTVYFNETLDSQETIAKFSSKYNIPQVKTKQIFTIIKDISKKDYTSAEGIALNKDILRNLTFGRSITENRAAMVAAKLGVPVKTAKTIFDDLAKNVYENIMDTKSAYWQYCTQTGFWKTNQNAYCKSLRWPGCSPETVVEDAFEDRVICTD